MQAMVLRSAGELTIADVDTPEPCREDVLVRVRYSGICGTDLKIFSGAVPVAYPRIMGHEMAGDVVSGGNGLVAGQSVLVDPVLFCGACADCRAGRTNLCATGGIIGREVDGGFADFVRAPRTHVHRLPDAIDPRSAPAIQVLTTCLHAQRRAGVGAGQSVAVVGLGVSGQLHAQLARARGAATVIGLSRSAWKRQVAEQLGTPITSSSGDTAIAAVRDATGGQGADIVIECTGHMKALADAIAMVRPGGTIVLFGIYTAREAALPFYQLYFKEPTIVSARAAKREDFPESIGLVASGAVSLSPLVTHTVPLIQLREALAMLEDDVDGRMKIILEH